jgi:hypothetical protein
LKPLEASARQEAAEEDAARRVQALVQKRAQSMATNVDQIRAENADVEAVRAEV